MTLANQADSACLMRLSGVAFPGEKDRQEWETQQEEARRRDHRRIGTVKTKPWKINLKLDEWFVVLNAGFCLQDQDLFFFNDVSPGCCFFLPKGAHIYNKLKDFIKVKILF